MKQVIVVRKDLKMRRGKEIAQGSHASMAFMVHRLQFPWRNHTDQSVTAKFTDNELTWLQGLFKKVVLQVNSEAELLDIAAKAEAEHIECHVITDAGLTEFGGVPTRTCLALGPDLGDKIDRVTSHLSLY